MQVTKKSFALATSVKPVAAAVAMAAALMAPQAQAVNVSQNGLGEVLLFPYYTVNNSFDTNINITNTSENAVVFKIRFREAHNSRDARDFNVILSPYDVWTATVTASPNGGARLTTADTTCTAGLLPLDLGNGRRGVDFTNYDYISTGTLLNADSGPTTLARNGEGYIEVIEMGHQKPTLATRGLPSPQLEFDPDDAAVGHNSKHVLKSNGSWAPRDCDAVRAAFAGGTIDGTADDFFEPINVLKGSANLLKSTEGKVIAYDPTVLANFYNPEPVTAADDFALIGNNLIVPPESQDPGLDDAVPAAATVIDNIADEAVIANFPPSTALPVSAVLSREVVVNQFSVNPANAAKTDWVITMPTKYFFVDERETGVDVAQAPFDDSDTFQNTPFDCSLVGVSFRFFDREEREQVNAPDVGFSPAPPGTTGDSLCFETSILTFNQSNVFGSGLAANVPVSNAGFNNGWMRLEYTGVSANVGGDGQIVSNEGVTFVGLPTIGFAATTLENGTNASAVLNYGMAWSHGYVTNIIVP